MKPTTPSRTSLWFPISIAIVSFAVFSGFLYRYDRAPWPTIGSAALALIYFCINLLQGAKPKDKQIDVQLSLFLASELLLAYFSHHDPGKGPDGDSPLSASRSWFNTNKHLRLDFAEIFPMENDDVGWLKMIEIVCTSSWLIALLTSLTVSKERVFAVWWRRLVFSILAVSYVFLHGVTAGLNGVSHRFFLVAYAFVALLFEAAAGIDSNPLICLFAGYTFFSAGFSKLVNSNFTWHDGQSLCRSVRRDFSQPFWGNFCSLSAPASLVFELAAPLLLLPQFGFWGRMVYVFCSLIFHLAIAVLMFPRYTPQAFSYALLFRRSPENKPKGRILFAVMCCILALTMLLRLDNWPLTAVPMYSTNLPNEFGSTMEEAYHAAKIVKQSNCISDFKVAEQSIHVVMQGGYCQWIWDISKRLKKRKLVKSILIRGMAQAILCRQERERAGGLMPKSCELNYWLDKFSRAARDVCDLDEIDFFLLLKTKPVVPIPVYTWKFSSLRELKDTDHKDEVDRKHARQLPEEL